MYIISWNAKNTKKFSILLFSLLLISSLIIFVLYVNRSLSTNAEEKRIIKYVEFNPTYESLRDTMKEDIKSHRSDEKFKIDWIEALSYLA